MVAVLASAKRKLIAKRGTYELLGCDIIVSQDLQPYLLEVNTNPAMFTDTNVQKELLPVLTKNTLDTVFDLYEAQSSKSVLDKLKERNYELLYCEETGYVYGADPEAQELNGLLCGNKNDTNLKDKQLN
jgi:tubulin--tyrosine ligase like protein 10